MSDELWNGNKVTGSMTMDDFYQTFKKILQDQYSQVCLNCNGNGCIWSIDYQSLKHCKKCRGTGYVAQRDRKQSD